jgi:hypothetical protein
MSGSRGKERSSSSAIRVSIVPAAAPRQARPTHCAAARFGNASNPSAQAELLDQLALRLFGGKCDLSTMAARAGLTALRASRENRAT